MPAGGTPPNPWKITTERGELLVFHNSDTGYREALPCDRDGEQVDETSERMAGIVVSAEMAYGMWRAAGNE